MATVAQVSQAMQAVLTSATNEADGKLGYSKRPDRAKFTASTLVQTLVFGWLAHPEATLEQLAQSAARVGVDASPQAVDGRFTLQTAALLQEVLAASLQHVISSDPVAIPLLKRFTGVYVQDSTTISLPAELTEQWAGCAGNGPTAGLKCGVQLELLSGGLYHLDLAAGRESDQRLPMQHVHLPAHSLRLADLGFYDLDVFAALEANQSYWLSKLRTTTLISDANSDDELPLLAFVQRLGELSQWQSEVWLGRGKRVRARLLVERVPQEVADQRRRRIRKEARDKGRTPSAAALALASWTILTTNVPAHLLSLREALVLTKIRWQIELVFKLWKSHGRVDEWRTAKAARILCEVYAKLLAMVLQHWMLALSCWQYPERSLVKAAQVIRDHAVEIAGTHMCAERLSQALTTIVRVLRHTARLNPRRKQPNTCQLLIALTTPS